VTQNKTRLARTMVCIVLAGSAGGSGVSNPGIPMAHARGISVGDPSSLTLPLVMCDGGADACIMYTCTCQSYTYR
jgi:hypothetical protein